MNSILAAAIGGALGGGLGSLVGNFAARLVPERVRRAVQTVITVGFMVAGWQLAVGYLAEPDVPTPAVVEARLLEDPNIGRLARAWRDADASSYRAFSERLVAGAREGKSQDQTASEARTELMAVAVPRISYLSDEQMNESARISISHYNSLLRNRPNICGPMFRGEPFGDITPYVSADALQQELGLLEAAFGVDMSVQKPTATGEVFTLTLLRILEATRAQVGDDVLMLTGEAAYTGRDAQFCAAAAAFYESILALPPGESAAFMRALRASS